MDKKTDSLPLIDFGDIDRNGMTDMLFYRDGAIYTFFNRYDANPATETNLCKQPYETKYLKENLIFSKFDAPTTD